MKIYTRIIIGFLFVLLMFSTVLITNYQQVQKGREISQWFTHSEEVLKNTSDLQRALVEVQSSMRGFLITGSDFYLQPYNSLQKTADSLFDKIKSEVSDNPPQSAKIMVLQDSFKKWILAWNNTVAAYKNDIATNGNAYAVDKIARKMVVSKARMMQGIKMQFRVFDQGEYELRALRKKELDKSHELYDWISIVFLVLAVIIGILTSIFISAAIQRRIRTISMATQKIADGDYTYRISDNTGDELKELSEAVNRMTASLEETFTKLKRSNEDLEQFAWISSHDLKEPLRMVSIYTQMLEKKYKGKIDEEADVAINYVVGGVKKMYVLINSLLDYARIGMQGQQMQVLHTEEVVNNALGNLKMLVDEREAQITCDELPQTISGIKVLMVQLFQNLVQNAIKFSGDRQPVIEIGSKKYNNKEWLFCVKDNGIGIDEKYQSQIFVIFQRLHTNDTLPGTGIGLANCKKIVELHGGRIWFESVPGQGTTFYFTVPIIAS